MKGVALLLGVLLLLGGGAVAAVQFAPGLDLSFLSSIEGAQEFLKSSSALYAGAGAAGFGLVMFIAGVLPGKKKRRAQPDIAEIAPAPPVASTEAPRPAPKPVETHRPAHPKAVQPQAAQPQAAPSRPMQPTAAQASPVQAAAAPKPAPIQPKPVASAHPPSSAAAPAKAAVPDTGPTWIQDPRLANRKRVSDLVTINDALKMYHKKNGQYPVADKLGGYLDRGQDWIPGLAPTFVRELPRDPALSNDPAGPQYLYVSDGADYKLVAQGVSLIGGTNVEVLGVKFDPSRNNTMEKAAFGFWTEKFAQA